MHNSANASADSASAQDADGELHYSLIPDLSGSTIKHKATTWRGFVAQAISPKVYRAKAAMPLMSLAIFGDLPSAKGSLRHEDNVREVWGAVGDYDAGEHTLDVLVGRARTAGIRCLFFTTASHAEGKLRCRIIAPASQAHGRSSYRQFAGMLNGALGGVLAGESFRVAQSFYFGRVEGVQYQAVEVDGLCIDDPTLECLVTPAFEAPGAAATTTRTTMSERFERAVARDRIATLLQLTGRVKEADEAKAALVIECPNIAQHSKEGGHTASMYFLPHFNGFAQGAFQCQHGHCEGLKRPDFLRLLGETDGEATNDGGADGVVDDPFSGMPLEVAKMLGAGGSVSQDAIVLPGPSVSIVYAARRAFRLMAATREIYRQNDDVVEIDDRGLLRPVRPDALRSRLEARGRTVLSITYVKGKGDDKGEYQPAYARCSAETARALLEARERRALPPITLVANAPVLVEEGGELVTLPEGYHTAGGGVLVRQGAAMPPVALKEAVGALCALLGDFDFASPGDRARAIAGIVGPAIRMAKLLRGPALLQTYEAAESQTGKGFLAEIVTRIYGEQPVVISQRRGGVGSLDESIGEAFASGKPFVQLDNVRGRIDSAALEAAITAPDGISQVRIPFRGNRDVDTSRVTISLTSNGAAATADLSNRMLVVRLRKQAAEYVFRKWPEGRMSDHLAARGGYYLACVHTVVRAWHAAGRPEIETHHTFKAWTGALNWIVQKLFGTVPLLEGHGEVARRISNPALTWLRALAVEVEKHGRLGQQLRAGELVAICQIGGLEIYGLGPGEDPAPKAIGRAMAQCFANAHGERAEIDVDGWRVAKLESAKFNELRKENQEVRLYEFAKISEQAAESKFA